MELDKKIVQEQALMKEILLRLGWCEVNKLRFMARQETDREQRSKISTQSDHLILLLGQLTKK